MSPEFNFHIKVDLPDRRAARKLAEELAASQSVKEITIFGAGEDIIEKEPPLAPEAGATKAQMLKYERLKMGLSLRELSALTGFSPSLLSLMESGRQSGSIKSVTSLMKVFLITEDDPRYQTFFSGVSRSYGRGKPRKRETTS